jgi:AmmeMemoRadiSam system protein B
MKAAAMQRNALIRPAAQAGRFYPAEPERLRAEIETFLAEAQVVGCPVPKAVIVPHAGYLYSGPVAAFAFAVLKPARERIHRVVLAGPAHYVGFTGLASSGVHAFVTPLGQVTIDKELAMMITASPSVRALPAAHQPEHCLEVELPFLQTVLADFTILPLLVGDASEEEVAAALDTVWGGPETLVVISSDLSHYHDYATARRLDLATAESIKSLDGNKICEEDACGWQPIRGLLSVARRRGLRCRELDRRNSGDTTGSRDRVVGYGAFAFSAE